MKTRRTSVVISLVFGLGVAACQGELHTGLEGLGDAGQGGSTGGLGTGGIATGGNMGGGGGGGVATGGTAAGGNIGGGGMAVDTGSAGSMCNGLPLPANSGPYSVCPPVATEVFCHTCEGLRSPECAAFCSADYCWECASNGWGLSASDCVLTIGCNADAGRDAAGGTGGIPTGGMGTGGITGSGGSKGDVPSADAGDAGNPSRSYRGIFVPTGSMAVGREYHTATLLPNGKVLIAGGWVHSAVDDTAEVASAELYDPGTGTFTATGSMNFARDEHTATLLTNGLVLIAGGVASAELYDPGTGTFTVTGSLNVARGGHTATLLANGRVLIAGGYNGAIPATPQPTDPDAGFFYTGTFPATAELYDPGTGTFTATGSLNAARDGHTATLLPNGKVLITGGNDSDLYLQRLASAELYDPGAGTFTAAASMAVPREGHTATLLANGMVLIAGGDNGELANAELFDPRVGTFTSTGGMANSRSNHTATLLANGRVLIAGGVGSASDFASAELYDPGTRKFVATGNMTGTRALHTATLLQNGMVLIAGGVYSGSGGGWSASAELYE